MATIAKVDSYPHIAATPDVRGGQPCIDGTRITVLDIVALHHAGMKPEAMLEHYSSRPLTLSEVHSALAYYYDHKAELDAEIAEDARWYEEQEKLHPARFGR